MDSKASESSNFDALYQEHHEWLVRWISRRTPSSDHAKDLAQDTFVRIITRATLPSDLRSPRAWLAKIAGNLAVDQARRAQLEKNYLEMLANMPELEQSSPQEQFELLDVLEQIDQLLNGLRSIEKKAFLMARLDGMAYKDIAQTLGISLSSVEKYMAKAMLRCYQARFCEA